jgi:hypothetical protein
MWLSASHEGLCCMQLVTLVLKSAAYSDSYLVETLTMVKYNNVADLLDLPNIIDTNVHIVVCPAR